ncbi:MAG: hypothetical protein WCO11_05550 [Sphingomonadales bacterium]|jgi:hypothetical protein
MSQLAAPATQRLPLRPVYVVTVLRGSFLLFPVQPVVARLAEDAGWHGAHLMYRPAAGG